MKVTVPQCPEWKTKRQERWEKIWKRAGMIVNPSRAERKINDAAIAARKEWYLNGDLTPLMEFPDKPTRTSELDISMVLRIAPTTDLDEYLSFFQQFAYWSSEQGLSFWGKYEPERNARFCKYFFHLYTGDHSDSTKEIYAHMLRLILPDENGVVTFPMTLGVDNWQPRQQVALCDCAADLLSSMDRYLVSP